jgi:GDPmannose 4,6-dehydratase
LKKAFITGVTGQDGSYLAEFLIEKGYEVHGLIRRNSDFTSKRINGIFNHEKFIIHYGDLTDGSNLYSILSQVHPDEVYNFGAQSHVGLSFTIPEYSADVDALGVLKLLTCIKDLKLDTKLYQASTSEIFGGLPGTAPQNEKSPFFPRSPYAVSKLFSYWMTCNYREAYGIFACNGILFNHESPRRGKTFVTKKITRAVANFSKRDCPPLRLGNLDVKRDWGYAKEYVEAAYLMLQQDSPDDYVIGSGKAHTVRYFVEQAFKCIGIEIVWRGKGLEEVGIDRQTSKKLVQIDPEFFRPLEVEDLCANPIKAKSQLGWEPKTTLDELIAMMVNYDIKYDEYGYPDRH